MLDSNFKEKYNNNLNRIEKAFRYFDREDIPIEEKEKQIDTFKQLLNEQNKLISKIGLKVGDIEIIQGFNRAIA